MSAKKRGTPNKPAKKRGTPNKPAGKAAGKAATGRPFTKDDPRINRTKPGPGRPRGELRDLCAKSVEDRIEVMCEIVDDQYKKASDRVAAFNALAKLSGIELTKLVGDDDAPPVQSVLRFSDGQEIVF